MAWEWFISITCFLYCGIVVKWHSSHYYLRCPRVLAFVGHRKTCVQHILSSADLFLSIVDMSFSNVLSDFCYVWWLLVLVPGWNLCGRRFSISGQCFFNFVESAFSPLEYVFWLSVIYLWKQKGSKTFKHDNSWHQECHFHHKTNLCFVVNWVICHVQM